MEVKKDERQKVPTLIKEGLSRPLKDLAEDAQREAENNAPVSNRSPEPGKPKYAASFDTTQGRPKVVGSIALPGFMQGVQLKAKSAALFNTAPHAPWVEFPTGTHAPGGREYEITAKRDGEDLWIPIGSMKPEPDPRDPNVKVGAGGTRYYVTDKVRHPGSEGQWVMTNAAATAIENDAEYFRRGLQDAARDLNLEVEMIEGSPSAEGKVVPR